MEYPAPVRITENRTKLPVRLGECDVAVHRSAQTWVPSETSHGRYNLLRIFLAVCVLMVSGGVGASADEPVDIKIGYLRQAPSKLRLSLIDVPAASDGLAGAQLAIDDDNATGRFLNQHYTLVEKVLGES